MRVVTWNVHGANKESAVWNLLLDLNPDIVLLQEVRSIPDRVANLFSVLSRVAIYKTGKPQRFNTAVLVKGEIVKEITLRSEYGWVNRELEFFKGNIIACTIKLKGQEAMNVASVYSPAWSLDDVWALRGSRPSDTGIAQIKLKSNPKVWMTEVVWSALKNSINSGERWIVGGDYNISETFDKEWQDKNGVKYGLCSSGNKDILDRMSGLGFTECLRGYHNKIIPTFKHSRSGIAHQMDHLFVTKGVYARLKGCIAGDQATIFGQGLSDHLPIIADFLG